MEGRRKKPAGVSLVPPENEDDDDDDDEDDWRRAPRRGRLESPAKAWRIVGY
jgi:hypothetical protein